MPPNMRFMGNTENTSYRITGGKPVKGEITCYGAKNFATKAMVAACLGSKPVTLTNMPQIGDVEITANLISAIGVTVEWLDETTMRIDPSKAETHKVTMPDSRSNRIPILLLPGLLHKFGQAEIPRLDGCNIGKRAVDIHESAVEAFGGKITVDRECIKANLPNQKRLKGTHFKLHYPSVGATETCLFLSVLAEGTSLIENVATEPEIMELITMLRSMGAIIFVRQNRQICVEGVQELHGTVMNVLGDRIEAASWASLACASDGEITVNGIMPNTMGNFLSYYRQVGGGFDFKGNNSLVFYRERPLTPITVETGVHPDFSTDWQQPFAVLLTQAEGISVIHETVYESRFSYTKVLNELGAHIQLSNQCLGSKCRFADQGHQHSALIHGKTALKAAQAPLEVPDLRAGLAYVIAAAIAEGETTLTHIDRIERGYGKLVERLDNFSLEIVKEEIASEGRLSA